MKEPKTTDYPIDMWRGFVVESESYRRWRAQDWIPAIDEMTPDRLKAFLDESEGTQDVGLCRFLLHVWDYAKYPFSPSETVDWPAGDLKGFADWLTDPSQPCGVFRPDRHEELWELESMIPDPQFARVENRHPARS